MVQNQFRYVQAEIYFSQNYKKKKNRYSPIATHHAGRKPYSAQPLVRHGGLKVIFARPGDPFRGPDPLPRPGIPGLAPHPIRGDGKSTVPVCEAHLPFHNCQGINEEILLKINHSETNGVPIHQTLL